MEAQCLAPLRLTGSPTSLPIDYVPLEEVINALGRMNHELEWGLLPGWSQMPFRWSSKEKRYVRHELRLFGNRARLRRVPIRLGLTKPEKLACTRLYKKVREEAREVFEAGALRAYAAHYASGISTPIEAPHVWRKQARPIFFTGRVVIREPTLPDRLADVVVERKAFDRWAAACRRRQTKTASVNLLRNAGELIAEHERQHGYRMTRGRAYAAIEKVAGAAGRHVSERQFKAYVWAPRAARAGRPKKALRTQYDLHSADFEKRLASLFSKN